MNDVVGHFTYASARAHPCTRANRTPARFHTSKVDVREGRSRPPVEAPVFKTAQTPFASLTPAVRPMGLAVACLVVFWGGCVGPGPPSAVEPTTPVAGAYEPVHSGLLDGVLAEVRDVVPFRASARDGTPLGGHVYLPTTAPPYAVVLELSPYWNSGGYGPSEAQDAVIEGRRTMARESLQPFIEAGFAVALVNMRGTGESGGCFQWGNRLDASDAYDVIEALAKEPWSSGAIGMTGLSYPAWSQYLAVSAAPPSLKAVIPVSGVIDAWSLWTIHGAAVGFDPPYYAPVYYLLFAAAISGTGALGFLPPGNVPDTGPDHIACPNYAPEAIENAHLVTYGDRNAYWDERDLRARIDASDVPVLATNGLTTGEGHILQFTGLWDIMPAERRLLVGQWAHGYPDEERPDFREMQVGWMDHYLRGGPKTVETGVVEYQDDAGGWHRDDAWPPDTRSATLHLSDGTLVADPKEVRSSAITFASVDRNPGPGVCADVHALYVSPPLAADVALAGHFDVQLRLASDLPDGNLAVFLYKTTGNGACDDGTAVEVRRAVSDLRHVFTETGRDFPTDQRTVVNLQSYPFASVLKKGERLVLAIGGGSDDTTPDPRMPVLTSHTDPQLEAFVRLPILNGNLTFSP